MCGICGELRFDGAPVDAARLLAMRDQLIHRGLGSEDAYTGSASAVGLGFRRLRIIDLTANASQPMTSVDGSIHLVFNGEIYNFLDLRTELVARGHCFTDPCATE